MPAAASSARPADRRGATRRALDKSGHIKIGELSTARLMSLAAKSMNVCHIKPCDNYEAWNQIDDITGQWSPFSQAWKTTAFTYHPSVG